MTSVSGVSDISDASTISFAPCYYAEKRIECKKIEEMMVNKRTHHHK